MDMNVVHGRGPRTARETRERERTVTPTISSLALLKVNYDTFRKDYFENFVPMVAECIRCSSADVISLPDLQVRLRTQFGLSLPQSSVKTLLNRVRKDGYVRVKNGVYYRNADELERLRFKDAQQRVVQVHDALVEEFVRFCFRRFNVDLSPEDADGAIESYLEENQLLVMNAVTQGTVIPKSGRSVKNARFLVASFIRHLQETHAAALGHLETVVKGHMLANAIFLPDPGSASRRFRDTEVYFDTPFLIKALGYEGESQREPCLELLDLIYETGANLRCFGHTRDEVRGVLDRCVGQVQANGSNPTSSGRDVLRNFRSQGFKSTDVMMKSNDLEKDLKELRIRVVDRPEHEREHQIDEDTLHEELEKNVRYSGPQQISRDVDSISAIVRMRKGRSVSHLEECGALFVTTNSNLAKFARSYFSEVSDARAVSPCLTDYALTNLLWLKRPTAAPDLPRKRVIADCYAATRPTERLWRDYLQEIERLKRMGGVSSDEYFMLRHSTMAESALMDATMGQEDGFTQGTVSEVLERVRSNIEAKKQVEVDSERASREAAERELEAAREQDASRKSRIRARSQRWASRVTWCAKLLLLSVLALATAYTFPWGLPSFASWGRYLLTIILLILFLFSMAAFWNGTTVEGVARQLEVALARWIERRLLALTEK